MRRRRGRVQPAVVLVLACLAVIFASCGACFVLPRPWVFLPDDPAAHHNISQPAPLGELFFLVGLLAVFLLLVVAFNTVAHTVLNILVPTRRSDTPEPEDSPAPPND